MKAQQQNKTKVLIVDDLKSNVILMANSLQDLGIEFLYAYNGYDAVSLTVKNNPELILLDIMMPGMDGFETCRKIRADSRTQDIPILFITAKSDDESILLSFQNGGQDYITKPFNPLELRARVLTHLELRTAQKSLKSLNKEQTEEINRLRSSISSINQDLKNLREMLEVYFNL